MLGAGSSSARVGRSSTRTRVWPAPGDPSRAGLRRGCSPSPRTALPCSPTSSWTHWDPLPTLQPVPHVALGTRSWPGALRALASSGRSREVKGSRGDISPILCPRQALCQTTCVQRVGAEPPTSSQLQQGIKQVWTCWTFTGPV